MRRHEAEIVRALSLTDAGWRLDLPPDLRTLYEHAYSGFAFAVVNDRGAVLFSSLPNRAALLPPGRPGAGASFFQRSHGPAVYYGGAFPERRMGHEVWIQVAQDLENPDVVVDDIVSAFLTRVAWLIAPLLLLLVAADYIIVRRAFAPVVQASQMAQGIGPASLSLRLPTERLPNEIAPLAEAVNQALDRLEQGFRIQRQFTADAAHELRTPLSILRMRVNALADRAVAREIEADIDVMGRIVGQLLSVAELETFVLDASRRVDLKDLCSRGDRIYGAAGARPRPTSGPVRSGPPGLGARRGRRPVPGDPQPGGKRPGPCAAGGPQSRSRSSRRRGAGDGPGAGRRAGRAGSRVPALLATRPQPGRRRRPRVVDRLAGRRGARRNGLGGKSAGGWAAFVVRLDKATGPRSASAELEES